MRWKGDAAKTKSRINSKRSLLYLPTLRLNKVNLKCTSRLQPGSDRRQWLRARIRSVPIITVRSRKANKTNSPIKAVLTNNDMADAKYTSVPAEPPPSYESTAQPTAAIPRLPLPLHLPLIDSLRAKRVILASASPRRRQLLAQVVFCSHNVCTGAD